MSYFIHFISIKGTIQVKFQIHAKQLGSRLRCRSDFIPQLEAAVVVVTSNGLAEVFPEGLRASLRQKVALGREMIPALFQCLNKAFPLASYCMGGGVLVAPSYLQKKPLHELAFPVRTRIMCPVVDWQIAQLQ